MSKDVKCRNKLVPLFKGNSPVGGNVSEADKRGAALARGSKLINACVSILGD